MGLLRGNYFLIGETADAALFLVIKDTDAGAIGTKNTVGQIEGQFHLRLLPHWQQNWAAVRVSAPQ